MQRVQQDWGINYRGTPAETVFRKFNNNKIEDIVGLFPVNYLWLSAPKLARDGLLYIGGVFSAKYS
jgi:hypothetical protein